MRFHLPLVPQNYFVYILTNDPRHTVLYIGVTNDLERRASEHSLGTGSQFARQYNAHKLIYFEAYPDPRSAIEREKQLKRWSRSKKEVLIARENPEWRDLFDEMHALKPQSSGPDVPRDSSTARLCRSARTDGTGKPSQI